VEPKVNMYSDRVTRQPVPVSRNNRGNVRYTDSHGYRHPVEHTHLDGNCYSDSHSDSYGYSNSDRFAFVYAGPLHRSSDRRRDRAGHDRHR